MSVKFEVYVGPFIRCEGGQFMDIADIDERLQKERGMIDGDDGNVVYFGLDDHYMPPLLNRQTRFDEYSDMSPVADIDAQAEQTQLAEAMADTITQLKSNYALVTVEWGIVPALV